jgi:hypothetical protein
MAFSIKAAFVVSDGGKKIAIDGLTGLSFDLEW